MRAFRTACLALALLAPSAAAAQTADTLTTAARLVARQPAGVMLRVNASNELVTGVLVRVAPDSVYLGDPPRALALRTIDDAWLQRRATGRGAKVGAIVGATAGAALFALGAVILSGCYECGVDGMGDVALATGIGAGIGAGSGFLVGALIGAGMPRWERVSESSAPPFTAATRDARRSGFSSFSVTPAATRAAEGGGVSLGASVAYLTQLTHVFALGPEVAVYSVDAPDLNTGAPCDPEFVYCPGEVKAEGGAWAVGGLARIGPSEGTVQPYALVGLGLYRFPYGSVLGGYSLGAGARWHRPHSSYALSLDGRWHSNATNSGDGFNPGFVTVGVGLTLLR